MHYLCKQLLCLPFVLNAGCASVGVIHSLDDVTAQVDQKGLFALEQQRLLSLSGLIPAGPPGSAYKFRAKRSPFTAIGIAQAEVDGESADTYVLRRSIPYAGTLEDLIALRDHLEKVRSIASQLIVAQLRLAIARGGAVLERQQQDVDSATGRVDELRKEFEKARLNAVKAMKQPGMMVIRTNTIRRVNLMSRIGAFLGLSAKRDEEHSGFAILAGLETDTLYVGADFDSWCDPLGKDWSLIGRKFPFILQARVPFIGQTSHEDIRVVTSRFAARHTIYTSDQLSSSSLQAKLDLTQEALEDLRSTLSDLDRLMVEAVLESVENLGSIGILGEVMQTKISRVDWLTERACDCPRSQVVYEVLTEYDDVKALARDGWRFHFMSL